VGEQYAEVASRQPKLVIIATLDCSESRTFISLRSETDQSGNGGFMQSRTARRVHQFVILACFAVTGLGSANAADIGPAPVAPEWNAPPPPETWTVRFTPYAWLSFLTGDNTVRGRTTDIEVNPIELIDHLTTSGGHIPIWMSYVEARHGPVSFYNDIVYANLGLSGGQVRVRPGQPDAGVAVGLDYDQAIVEVGMTYEIARWLWGPSPKDGAVSQRTTSIDLISGARYWHQSANLNLALSTVTDLDGLVVSGNRAIARSGSVDWIDSVTGVRLRHQLFPGHEIVLRGDVGGFGYSSKFSWQAIAAYTWDVARRDGVTWSGTLGYRALDVDFEQSSGRQKYRYDVLQHGPLVGLTIGF
jgi:hypothetical protein